MVIDLQNLSAFINQGANIAAGSIYSHRIIYHFVRF